MNRPGSRFARRGLVAGVVAGGLATTASGAPADAAAGSTKLVKAAKLKAGDLVVGPNGSVVRIASRRRLANGRQQLRYTHPNTGAATPFSAAADKTGYASAQQFVVLRRGVTVGSVRLTGPTSTGDRVIDGGAP